MTPPDRLVLSVMLAVPDTPTAVAWYRRAVGATLLWNSGWRGRTGDCWRAVFSGGAREQRLGEPGQTWRSRPHVSKCSAMIRTRLSHALWRQEQTTISTRSGTTRCPGARIVRAGSKIRLGISGSSGIGRHYILTHNNSTSVCRDETWAVVCPKRLNTASSRRLDSGQSSGAASTTRLLARPAPVCPAAADAHS